MLGATGVAAGSHEGPACEPSSSQAEVDTLLLESALGGRFYVVLELPQMTIFDFRVFHETNGLDGLQRDDELAVDETCGHGADEVIF